MSKDMNKILERVQKMLALGKDAGATEAERDTALKMAYKVLAKYNLSLADLPQEQTENREMLEITICGDKWIRTVCHQVAKLFFCNYFFMRTRVSGKETHHFIGRQSNVETARYMAEYVVKGIKREAAKRFGQATSPDGRAFGTGASVALIHRVNEMLAQQDVEGEPGTAVVIYDLHKSEEEANASWLSNNTSITLATTKNKRSRVNLNSFDAGKEFGKTISLNRQVNKTNVSARRLA